MPGEDGPEPIHWQDSCCWYVHCTVRLLNVCNLKYRMHGTSVSSLGVSIIIHTCTVGDKEQMEQEEIKFLRDNHCEDTEQDNGGNKDLYLEGVENSKYMYMYLYKHVPSINKNVA